MSLFLRATVRRAVGGRYAMHHFEKEGQVLNALATPDSNDVQYPLNSSNMMKHSSVVRHLTLQLHLQ